MRSYRGQGAGYETGEVKGATPTRAWLFGMNLLASHKGQVTGFCGFRLLVEWYKSLHFGVIMYALTSIFIILAFG